MASTDGLVRGMPALDTGQPIRVPVGEQCLGRVFNLLGHPIDNKGPMPEGTRLDPIHKPAPTFADQETETHILETGIKVIDLLEPYP